MRKGEHMSKYAELVRAIKEAIDAGEYLPGSRLPTIPVLCERYGVSNTTVKRALDELEQEGLVSRRRGSGVFVKSTASLRGRSSTSVSGQMSGLTAEYASEGQTVTSVVNEFSIEHPNETVAEALDLQPDAFVYYICRTRVVGGKPVNVEYTYMPLTRIPGLVERHLSGSIYRYIERELGLKIDSAHRTLKAVAPTSQELEWLGIGPDEPLLEVRQTAYLDDGVPFEYSTTHHINDYEFFVVSTH